MDARTQNLVEECKRQEESCLYTSTTLFEWLKSMRRYRVLFVVIPIVFGGIATWPLFKQQPGYEWLTGLCALLAGITPAIYKALNLDVSLDVIAKHAHQYKILQDRFRQAWRVTAIGEPDNFVKEFHDLMARMDTVRSTCLTPPECFFKKARRKIMDGHYEFGVDCSDNKKLPDASNMGRSNG